MLKKIIWDIPIRLIKTTNTMRVMTRFCTCLVLKIVEIGV